MQKTKERKPAACMFPILHGAARKIGATILLEPEWGAVGQVTYKSGVKRYFSLSGLDLNTMGASAIARDKDYTKFFLRGMDYSVPDGRTFFRKDWSQMLSISGRGLDDAYAYAKTLGFPVFVKPNGLSSGKGVCKVWRRAEFYKAARQALRLDKVMLVEQAVSGRDYRIVVLDGRVICAYERTPLEVVGDGFSTVGELLNAKQKMLSADGRDIAFDQSDFRLMDNLKRKGQDFESVLSHGYKLRLLDNANLSSGGDSIDVTDSVHSSFGELAIRISRDMGLRLVGVDLVVAGEVSSTMETTRHWIIEINSAPGLQHFGAIGKRQKKVVEDLYLEVLLRMERTDQIGAGESNEAAVDALG